jgi:hypothetical protein
MSTPDGISTEDWDVVHELAVNLVNTDEERSEECRARLLRYLDKLEEKYGELPSILATRADYVDDLNAREQLLTRAYSLAENRRDGRNALYLAHSLAELYVEEFKNGSEGRKWLERLRQRLVEVDDSWFAEEYERLLGVAEHLSGGTA